MVDFSDYNHHWSYYLAIENQLEGSSRYVEFTQDNLNTYSIEFARILLSAASEADVILKQFCRLLEPNSRAESINQYQSVISQYCPELIAESITMTRFGIRLMPWDNWNSTNNPPDWWTGNNKVKHHRHTHFSEASLKNAVNAVGALHILIVHYYKNVFTSAKGSAASFRETTDALVPKSALLFLSDKYYFQALVLRGGG